ncbi:protein TolQ [Lacibacterium aquatile]|uniref:Tol-Pal system protein TolQ n=1 Tax=Lacibacterium aquatile TaxID=1168082 RepID=A0ABW5DR68_9PROT
MQGTVDPSALAGAAPVHDLSMIGLFLQADLVVKLVMLSLVFASVWSWAIIIDKLLKIRRLTEQAEQFEEAFWSGGNIEELYDRIGDRAIDPMSAVFAAAMREWRRSAKRGLSSHTGNLQQRIERVMSVTVGREMDSLEKWTPFLASVGSTAPFIGLFGTVWGIMNSFSAIAASKNTSLAVVAPGIAEALFATAIGLVAAIPAVLAYNKISNDLARYANRLENFSAEFGSILSRQIDIARTAAE